MVRKTALIACASIIGFGVTLERPTSEVQARRRCCCYTQNSCGYQTQYNQQVCAPANTNQTYYRGDPNQYGTQYQNGTAAPPPPAPDRTGETQPAPYRDGTRREAPPAPAARTVAPSPPPAPAG